MLHAVTPPDIISLYDVPEESRAALSPDVPPGTSVKILSHIINQYPKDTTGIILYSTIHNPETLAGMIYCRLFAVLVGEEVDNFEFHEFEVL